MQIERYVECFERRPQWLQVGVVEVLAMAAAIDEGADKSQLRDAALELGAGSIDILQVQSRKAAEALGLLLNRHLQCVVGSSGQY